MFSGERGTVAFTVPHFGKFLRAQRRAADPGPLPDNEPWQARGRPQVVAHRGSSAVMAEHTLGAYVAALDEGADALECDVRLTADGHLVCVHDRSVRRTADEGGNGVVSAMELADLEDLDFASWKNPWADLDDEVPDTDPEMAKVLTLRRLLETVASYPRRIELAIETKHPTRYAGLVERRLVRLLDEFGWAGKDSPARVMSFSWVALRRIRRLAPDLELVMLAETRTHWYRSRPFVDNDWASGPGIEMVREHPDLVAKIVACGNRVSLLGGERPGGRRPVPAARHRRHHHRPPGGRSDVPDRVWTRRLAAWHEGTIRLGKRPPPPYAARNDADARDCLHHG